MKGGHGENGEHTEKGGNSGMEGRRMGGRAGSKAGMGDMAGTGDMAEWGW